MNTFIITLFTDKHQRHLSVSIISAVVIFVIPIEFESHIMDLDDATAQRPPFSRLQVAATKLDEAKEWLKSPMF